MSGPDQQQPVELSDLDTLLHACLTQAVEQLQRDGDFWPFAMAVSRTGDLVAPDVQPGEARPEPEHVVQLLRDALTGGAAQLRATAVCSDVRVRKDGVETDAVQLELEPAPGHEGDAPVLLVVPYTLPGPELGEPVQASSVRRTWP